MKNKSVSHSILTGLFTVLAFAVCNSSARADCRDTTWTGHGDGRDWFDANNWDNCEPDHYVDAFINNGKALIDHQVGGGGATARSLTLGASQGNSGQVSVDGVNNFLAVFPRCENGVPVPGAGDIYVGKAGSGTVYITNGATVYTGHAYIAPVVNPVRPASNGAVKIDGEESTWVIFGDECRGDAGLFIGCTATSDEGGTAFLDIGGGTVVVSNLVNDPADARQAVKVGLSGTLTGNGTVELLGPGRLARTMTVLGTLTPSGTLTIQGNLTLISKATTMCNVTPQAWDRIELSAAIQQQQVADGGYAHLDGRLTVIMTGDFSSGPTRFTLLHAESAIDPNTKFQSESIKFPTNQGFKPKITYDYVGNNVYLDLVFNL